RECLADSLVGNLTIAKRAGKKTGIDRIPRESVDELLEVLSHLDPVLDRKQDHLLEVAGPLVPEEPRPLVVAEIDERHRAAICQAAMQSLARGPKVGKRV